MKCFKHNLLTAFKMNQALITASRLLDTFMSILSA